MKTTLKINSVINIIILVAIFTPAMPWVAMILGAWQYGGNLILLAVQAINTDKVLLLKARGWYTLLSTGTLVLLFTMGDKLQLVAGIVFVSSLLCAIWYTVICQAELKNIKKKQAALDTNLQLQ